MARPKGAGSLTFDKAKDLLVLVCGLSLLDKINLVLENENVLELHDLNSCQVL